MNIQELLENSFESVEEFILNCVGDRIENVSEIHKMLCDINYLDNKNNLISQTTECEILDISEYHISKYDVNCGFIRIKFNMTFIMQTFINSEFIWRIQSVAKAEIDIENNLSTDFRNFNSDNYKEYIDLIKINNIKYYDTECDTLYLQELY